MQFRVSDHPHGIAAAKPTDLYREVVSRRALPNVGCVVLAALAIGLWAHSLGQFNPSAATPSGLVNLLPATWWASMLLSAFAVALALLPERPSTPAIVAALTAMLLVLHGTLPFAETTPRFASAYTISGFSQYLADTGHTIPNLDARMLWPGMFSAAGMASRAMGVPAIWFLRGSPLCFEAIYLLPVKAIANAVLRTPRARWAALPIFLAGNWIDQDYFSPQAVNLLLYLVVIAVAIRAFGTRGDYPRPIGRMVRWAPLRRVTGPLGRGLRLQPLASEEAADPVLARGEYAALFGLLLLMCAASVPSHQFSPATLTVSLFGLAIAGRTKLRTMWLLMGLWVLAWLCWVGEPYWVGHFKEVFGGVSQLGTAVNSNVGRRLHGTSNGRRIVQYSRAAAAALVWVSAMLSLLYLRRRGLNRLTLGILLVMPTGVSLVVTYGGEALLRVLLFSLPAAAILLGGLLDLRSPKRLAVTGYAVVGILLLALFPITRFGNEQFEAMTSSEEAAAVFVGSHVPSGSLVVVANGDQPLEGYSTGHFRVSTYNDLLYLGRPQIEGKLASQHEAVWIYLSRSQEEYGESFLGLPAGWLNQIRTNLDSIPQLHTAFSASTVTVLRYEPSPSKSRS